MRLFTFIVIPVMATLVVCYLAFCVFGCARKESTSASVPPAAKRNLTPVVGGRYILFTPGEAQLADCAMVEDVTNTPSGSVGIRLSSKLKARYGFTPQEEAINVIAGDRYRVSTWFKVDEKTIIEPGSPGVILRATFFIGPHTDYPGGHVYVSTRGAVMRNSERLLGTSPPIQWKNIAGVVEIPQGVTAIKLYLFCWHTAGNVYFSEPKLEKVEKSVPITPLL